MNFATWLQQTAKRTPDAPALFTGSTQDANYAEFASRAQSIAQALQNRGILAGERIAFFAKNSTAYLEALYGAWWLGAVVVPINNKLHPKEAAWIMESSGAKLAFVSSDLIGDYPCEIIAIDTQMQTLRGAKSDLPPHPTQAHDLVWLFYTSGTTGKPKGVMLSARNLALMSYCYLADVDDVASEDRALYAAPMSHGAGMYNFVHVLKGAAHVVPKSGGFDCKEIFDISQRLGKVSMFAAPTMVKRMVDYAKGGASCEGFKTIVYGGGPMYLADIVEAVYVMGPCFAQIYGQVECPMAITSLRKSEVADRSHANWRSRLASVGTAQSGVRIQIQDASGNALPPGQIGEICVQGDLVMQGYWQNHEETQKALQNGWLLTGDMGTIDADGFVTLHDRSKDVIISGGTNIYPREVEEVLLLHPEVAEVSVIGRADPEWGEEVVAFIVGTARQEELDAYCLEHIARFKRPKAYYHLDALPKNNYGKVLKTELRKTLEKTK